MDPSLAVYTDYSETPEPTAKQLALNLVETGQRAILVIDNCNPQTHSDPSGCTYSRECFEPALRGQGTSFATGQASVIGYFAEVPGFQPSYYDLESLQVVKGPQGTLFGETATGGVMLFGPRRPTNDLDGYVDVQAGNLDYHQIEGAVGGAIIEDKLMVRAAGQFRKRDGFTQGIRSDGFRSKLDNVDKAQWRISAILKPTERTEFYFLYAGSRTRSNGGSSLVAFIDPRLINPGVRDLPLSAIPSLAAGYEFYAGSAPPPGASYRSLVEQAFSNQIAAGPRTAFYNYNLANETKFNGLIGQFKWDITDNITFRNIYGLFWTSNKGAATDQDGVPFSLLDTRGRFALGTTNPIGGERPTTGGWPDRSWRNEARLQGTSFNGKLDWQTGFYYRSNKQRNFRENGGFLAVFGSVVADPLALGTCAALKVAAPCSSMTRAASTSYAGYGQGTFAVTDRLKLTAGYRHTWARSHSDLTATPTVFVNATSSYFPGLTFPQAMPITGRDPAPGAGIIRTDAPNEKVSTYTLTADWQVTDQLLLYIAHRKGYKGGGVNSNAPVDSSVRTFGPETLKDVEIGAKTRFEIGGLRGRASIAAYRGDYKDVQRSIFIPNGGGQSFTSNVANARIQGIEFEGSISPANWLTIGANFAYTDAKYKNWTDNTTCAVTVYFDTCAGLPGTTPVIIDHANGLLTIGSKQISYKPDRFGDSSKYMWSVQPTIYAKDWVGEDISLTANLYYKSSFVGGGSPVNTTYFADRTPIPRQSFFGRTVSAAYQRPGYTLLDMRMDWRNIRGSNFTFSVVGSNVTNKKYFTSGTSGIFLTGTETVQLSEPRTVYARVRYDF